MAMDNINIFLVQNAFSLREVEQECRVAVHGGFMVVDVQVIDGKTMIISNTLISISFMGDDDDFADAMGKQFCKLFNMDLHSSHKWEVEIRYYCYIHSHP